MNNKKNNNLKYLSFVIGLFAAVFLTAIWPTDSAGSSSITQHSAGDMAYLYSAQAGPVIVEGEDAKIPQELVAQLNEITTKK